MATAETLFSEHGFHATGIVDLARAGDFSIGSVYSHFQGKDQILHELVTRRIRDLRMAMGRAPREPGHPRMRTEFLLGVILRWVEENPGLYKVIRQTRFVDERYYMAFLETLRESFRLVGEAREFHALSEHGLEVLASAIAGIADAATLPTTGRTAPVDRLARHRAMASLGLALVEECSGSRWLSLPPDHGLGEPPEPPVAPEERPGGGPQQPEGGKQRSGGGGGEPR